MSVSSRLLSFLLLAGVPVLAAAQPAQAGQGSAGRGAERAMPQRGEHRTPPRRPGHERPEADRAPMRAQAADAPQQQQRSLSEAVRWVQRSTGGQILGAELVPYEGRNITRVKYMDDRGRVRYMDHPGSGEGSRRSRRDNHE